MATLGKYSLGIGDRFGRQGVAQLRAVAMMREAGVAVTPVWNKSNREHQLIGTTPPETRAAADAAVRESSWNGPYFVDADHISLASVDTFVDACDFFTIDVADAVGKSPDPEALTAFISEHQRFVGMHDIPGLDAPLTITVEQLAESAARYLHAVQEAGRLSRHIAAAKGVGRYVTEVSLDEVTTPQSPRDLFLILLMLAWKGVPAQTIAPKFSGEFFKGIDYVGDTASFAREFTADVAIVHYARQAFSLPDDLKISIHSGSDKFSLYPIIHETLRQYDAGIHLKTAGTTWLEELIGLALAGDDGVALVTEIYQRAYQRREELCAPYATVTAIDPAQLPTPQAVATWTGEAWVRALQHNQRCPAYNPHLRQLLHVAFRIAAEMGERYREALTRHALNIAPQVTKNLYQRHLAPLLLGKLCCCTGQLSKTG